MATADPDATGPAAPRVDAGAAGIVYALAAFGIWGLVPIYFRLIGRVPALEVVAHRVVWAAVLLCLALVLRRRGRLLLAELRAVRRLLFLSVTALLVSGNWLIYIWSIQHDRLLEASLGYYINPLVNVLLGMLFLHERLNLRQGVAVALATIAVLNLIVALGVFPWIALSLALLFGFYGLLRKKATVDPTVGLTVETILLTPLALAFLVALALQGEGAFGRGDILTDLLLAGTGIMTALPLFCFLQGARRLRLSTLGLMQYLAPSLNFLLAVVFYHEPFTWAHFVTFLLIWVALAIYSFDAFSERRAQRLRHTGSVAE
jgi:chloramphenicol-sensitive protein RarD